MKNKTKEIQRKIIHILTTKKHLCIFEIWKKFVNLTENNKPMP